MNAISAAAGWMDISQAVASMPKDSRGRPLISAFTLREACRTKRITPRGRNGRRWFVKAESIENLLRRNAGDR